MLQVIGIHTPGCRFAALFFLMLCQGAFAAPADPVSPYITRPASELLVKNMPPPRDQGELAFCYAAVPAVLMERHRCQRENLDCAALNPGERLSMLDIASANDPGAPTLHEFGNILRVFHGLVKRARGGKLLVARESCMPYSALDRLDMPDRPAHLHLRAGWENLQRLHDDLLQGRDRRNPATIRRELAARLALPASPGVQEQLFRRTRSGEVDQFPRFAWQLLSNENCQSETQGIRMSGFHVQAWPPAERPASRDALQAKIQGLMERNLPASLSYCARWETRGGDQRCLNRAGHASIIVGQREVCHRETGDCQLLYKLQNSFGNEWNQSELLVWVPAHALLDAALELQRPAHLLVWLE